MLPGIGAKIPLELIFVVLLDPVNGQAPIAAGSAAQQVIQIADRNIVRVLKRRNEGSRNRTEPDQFFFLCFIVTHTHPN